jgi:hypothetical protein
MMKSEKNSNQEGELPLRGERLAKDSQSFYQ